MTNCSRSQAEGSLDTGKGQSTQHHKTSFGTRWKAHVDGTWRHIREFFPFFKALPLSPTCWTQVTSGLLWFIAWNNYCNWHYKSHRNTACFSVCRCSCWENVFRVRERPRIKFQITACKLLYHMLYKTAMEAPLCQEKKVWEYMIMTHAAAQLWDTDQCY